MMTEPNDFGKFLHGNWYRDVFMEIQKSLDETIQKAVEKYHALPVEEKLDMIQAILYIICKSEKTGCSHRVLMDELGVYPSAFSIDELMIVHNALTPNDF